MSIATKLLASFRSRGLSRTAKRALRSAYCRGIRPFLPSTGEPVMYSGYASPFDRKLFDTALPASFLPDRCVDHPEYEATLIAGLHEHVRPDDTIVIVGGGYGITALVAAKLAKEVIVYEGSTQNVALIRKTFDRNHASTDRMTIHAAVVGQAVAVWGRASAFVVDPTEFPRCDVLEMDCEGAELGILSGMIIRPRVCLVETHGLHGSPTSRVHDLLKELGYAVKPMGMADPGKADFCRRHDIQVLAAVRDEVV